MRLERQPRTVVAREHDQRPSVDAGRPQRIEDSAGAPVDLLDDVAVDAGGAVPDELGRPGERNVRHVVREVEEERPRLVGVDEAHGFVGVAPGQRAVIDRLLDHVAVPHQRHVPVLRLRIVVRRGVVAVVRAATVIRMSCENGSPNQTSKPCAIGRNGGRWPRCHLPTIAVA